MHELVPYTLLFVSLFFEVFLLVSFLERRLRPAAEAVLLAPHMLPKVAIIVPCFNEEKTIGDTLRSLLALDYPHEKLEVLVVDDGSTDATRAAAEEFAEDGRVRIFRKENGGKHTAMNHGLARTNAELIGCLDADSVVAPEALKRTVAVFADERVAAVTPGIHVRNPHTLLQHMQNVEYRLAIFNRFIFALLGSAFITPGPFSIFRASVVRELGGWRFGHSTEDMELALRMQEHGHLIANAPRAVVHTSTPRTVRALLKQRVRWTYGLYRNAFDYRHMFGNKRFGNLGLVILPAAIISIGTGIYFFARIMFYGLTGMYREMASFYFSGVVAERQFALFYVNTSMMWFIVVVAIALVLALIAIGSYIGTGSRRPPTATPLFLLFYGFLVPLWLTAALVRAVTGRGVKWR
jgi:cellulose synthase/poly-beta-1,6-N-acetylglucosamine synthase-like glycosyltransferase